MRILLIEDDTLMQETLNDFLRRHGYQVTSVGSVAEAEDATFETYYDLYLIDINLPDGTGMELLESLRFADDKTPAMFLTALTDIQTIVTCFDLGALDYIKKPFHPEELLARIKAKLETKAIHYGHISLSLDHRIVQCNGETIDLPNVQRRILEKLLLQCGTIVTKEELYECLDHGSDTALRVAISKLKQRLGLTIKNIRGRGYLLEEL